MTDGMVGNRNDRRYDMIPQITLHTVRLQSLTPLYLIFVCYTNVVPGAGGYFCFISASSDRSVT